MRAAVKALIKRLAIEHEINIDPGELGVKETGFEGPSKTSKQKIKSFINTDLKK